MEILQRNYSKDIKDMLIGHLEINLRRIRRRNLQENILVLYNYRSTKLTMWQVFLMYKLVNPQNDSVRQVLSLFPCYAKETEAQTSQSK